MNGRDYKAQAASASPESNLALGVREAKYRRILDAAVEVIAEKGFANSRVSEIAARAGVADGTIYL
ncbi:MAG: helix-turn-helix domain-containing protein, partial [Acidobacteriaceae bacterium]